jgi:Family of unknown function (DUF6116)
MPNPITGGLLRFAGNLRFPTLFVVTAGLFLLDLIIPDFIPFADELLLGLLALLFANLRRKPGTAGPVQPL